MSSNKILIYTSNPEKTPHSMADVLAFADSKPKYRLANVELSPISSLRTVKAGDRLFTKKGNTIYILRAYDCTLEQLPAEERAFVEACSRKGMKNVNITGVRDVTKFENWCTSRSASEVIEKVCQTGAGCTTKTSNKMSNIKDALIKKFKSQFLPTRVDDARLTFSGEVAVINPKRDGYRVISANGDLTDYPEAMTFSELPVFTISRPIAQIKEGDVVRQDGKYYRVVSKSGNSLSCISYSATSRVAHAVKDALLGTANFDVVVSMVGAGSTDINPLMLATILNGDSCDFDLKDFMLLQLANAQNANSGLNGGLFNNPLMFLLLSKDGKKDIDPMMFLLMGNGAQGGMNLCSNPAMALALLSGDSDSKGSNILETMLMAQAFGGNAGGMNFGSLFGTPVAAAPEVAVPAPKKASPRKAKAAAAPKTEE